MKGNLSKKKGFLRDLEEADLSSIADILEERYGEKLNNVELKENKTNVIDMELPSEKKYPSEHAVSKAIKAAKDEADAGVEQLYEHISTAYVSFGALDNELRKYYTKKEIDQNKENVSNKVSDIKLATNSVDQYPTVEAVKKYIAEQLANWGGGGTNPTPSATSKVENGVLTLVESGSPTLFASIDNKILLISQIGNYYKTAVENQVLTLV